MTSTKQDRSTAAAVGRAAPGDDDAHTSESPPNSVPSSGMVDTAPATASQARTGDRASIPPSPGAHSPDPDASDGVDDADGDTVDGVDDDNDRISPETAEARRERDKAKVRARSAESRAESLQADLTKEREEKAQLVEVNKSLTAKLAEIRRERLTAQVREWIDPDHESMVTTIVDALDAETDDQRRATLWRDRFGSLRRRGRTTGGAIGGRPGRPMQLRDSPAAKSESPI